MLTRVCGVAKASVTAMTKRSHSSLIDLTARGLRGRGGCTRMFAEPKKLPMAALRSFLLGPPLALADAGPLSLCVCGVAMGR